MTTHIAIIGAYGSAGVAAAQALVDDPAVRLTLIDDGDPGGGLCIPRGCMPSKEVLSAAEHRYAASHDPVYTIRRRSTWTRSSPARTTTRRRSRPIGGPPSTASPSATTWNCTAKPPASSTTGAWPSGIGPSIRTTS